MSEITDALPRRNANSGAIRLNGLEVRLALRLLLVEHSAAPEYAGGLDRALVPDPSRIRRAPLAALQRRSCSCRRGGGAADVPGGPSCTGVGTNAQSGGRQAGTSDGPMRAGPLARRPGVRAVNSHCLPESLVVSPARPEPRVAARRGSERRPRSRRYGDRQFPRSRSPRLLIPFALVRHSPVDLAPCPESDPLALRRYRQTE